MALPACHEHWAQGHGHEDQQGLQSPDCVAQPENLQDAASGPTEVSPGGTDDPLGVYGCSR